MKLGNQKAKQPPEVGCKTNCARSKGIHDGRTRSVTRRERKRVFLFFIFCRWLVCNSWFHILSLKIKFLFHFYPNPILCPQEFVVGVTKVIFKKIVIHELSTMQTSFCRFLPIEFEIVAT
jgi:hypothetical protein